MPTEEKQICCWVSRTWVTVIAWVQIVLCTTAAITELVFLTDTSTVSSANDNKVKPDDNDLAVGILIVYLLTYIADVFLGVVLLVGNKKKKTSFLWVFIILTGITTAICLVCDIVQGFNEDQIYFFSAAITGALGCFILYVVHLRVREITFIQQGSSSEKV